LGAFGQEGVERVIDIFDAELKIVMQQTGATSTDQISKEALVF
jgi:isopentenyl diphosphate isomerase/L-lactate dehydrogenase-like FMN-dependent dehydrogenase